MYRSIYQRLAKNEARGDFNSAKDVVFSDVNVGCCIPSRDYSG